MDARKVNQAGGKWLKALRERLGLSTRAVQGISKKIADDKQNQEFYLSHNWVTDIENGKFTPGMFKVYSLSTIYDRKYSEVASHFGLHLEDQRRDSASLGFPRTHLLSNAEEDDPEKVSLPIEFKPGFRFEKTNLLARVIEKWDEVPVGLLQHLDLRKSVYGYVGLEDFTLFPIIRPGSLVQIDATQRKISSVKWKNEYERPIYFTELRDGYAATVAFLLAHELGHLVLGHTERSRVISERNHVSLAIEQDINEYQQQEFEADRYALVGFQGHLRALLMSSVIFFFGPMAFVEAFARPESRTHPLYTNRAARLASLLPQESADATTVRNIIETQIKGFRRVAAMREEAQSDIRHRIHKTMPLDLAYRVIQAVKEAVVAEIGCLETINESPS